MKPEDLDFLAALVRARSGIVLTGERGFFAEHEPVEILALAQSQRASSGGFDVLHSRPGHEGLVVDLNRHRRVNTFGKQKQRGHGKAQQAG